MLTLNETFAVPDADQAWYVINDLAAVVPCVPGARVKSVDGPRAVKAEIQVRMGAMGMTFTGPVKIESTETASRTITIKANMRETLGQSYAMGDITICLGDGDGTIEAIANIGGKAADGRRRDRRCADEPRPVVFGEHRKRLGRSSTSR
jgi:carbon monoxide dehydrogenase subunit G